MPYRIALKQFLRPQAGCDHSFEPLEVEFPQGMPLTKGPGRLMAGMPHKFAMHVNASWPWLFAGSETDSFSGKAVEIVVGVQIKSNSLKILFRFSFQLFSKLHSLFVISIKIPGR